MRFRSSEHAIFHIIAFVPHPSHEQPMRIDRIDRRSLRMPLRAGLSLTRSLARALGAEQERVTAGVSSVIEDNAARGRLSGSRTVASPVECRSSVHVPRRVCPDFGAIALEGRVAKRVIVSGRVQGVFYRACAQQEAARLGVVGWVRNLRDGRVEAFVEGEVAAVEGMLRWFPKGSPHSRVTAVDVEDVAPEGRFDAFFVVG